MVQLILKQKKISISKVRVVSYISVIHEKRELYVNFLHNHSSKSFIKLNEKHP